MVIKSLTPAFALLAAAGLSALIVPTDAAAQQPQYDNTFQAGFTSRPATASAPIAEPTIATVAATVPVAAAAPVAQADTDAAVSASELAELRDIIRLQELRLRELENDVVDQIEESESFTSETEEVTEEVGERLEFLEEQVEEQEEAIADIDSLIPSFVVSGHKKPTMKLFGRIHLDYWTFPGTDSPGIDNLEGEDPQDRFNFRRMRIGVGGDLNDNMFYKYEGEFADGNNPSYRDAYLGFKSLPLFNTVIAGNHKRPYGLDHLNSSRYNVFIERPFIVEALNQDSRRIGVSSNGVSEDQQFNWRYGIWHHELTQTQSGFISDHYQPEIASRMAWTAWYDESSGGRGYAHLAAAGSYAVPDGRTAGADNAARYRTRPEARTNNRWLNTGRILGTDSVSLRALEGVFNVGALQFTGEYMENSVDRADAIGGDVNLRGGYVQAAYFLTGEHTPWNRQTGTLGRVKPFENFFAVKDCDCETQRGWGAWQLATRWSYADLSDENIDGGVGESLTLGLNWWWNQNARMQFNYIHGEIDRPSVGSGNYDIIGMRFMVDF